MGKNFTPRLDKTSKTITFNARNADVFAEKLRKRYEKSEQFTDMIEVSNIRDTDDYVLLKLVLKSEVEVQFESRGEKEAVIETSLEDSIAELDLKCTEDTGNNANGNANKDEIIEEDNSVNLIQF